jgi:hypothetical protein
VENLPSLRASDADRDQAAARLREAMAEGRLSGQELEERLELLFASRTYGELDALLADLPVNRSRSRAPVRAARLGGAVAATMLVVAMLGTLAVVRGHSAAGVVGSRVRQFRIPGPLADPHRATVIATSMVGLVAILLICAALAWALTRRRPSSNI